MTSTQPQNYMLYQSLPSTGRTILPLTQRPVPNTVSPHLFPFLSRRLAQTAFDVDNEMKDVAQTLVALKGSIKKEIPDSANEDIGPTWRHHKRSYSSSVNQRRPSSPVIVTNHPSLDHAYSSSRILEDDAPSHSSSSSSSSIDEEYDFGDADEECESDYHSDMDWDSDTKDEVDGDVPASPSNNDRNKMRASDCDADNRKAAPEDTEDDEQKKLHEGASALLNLAGLLFDQSRERAGGIAAPVNRERHTSPARTTSQHRKGMVSKGRPPKKLNHQKEADLAFKRTPSKSKRKNAGSNAKYDNEEYSLGKNHGKASLSPARSKKAQSLKSPGSKPGRKVAGTLSKVKSSVDKIKNGHKSAKKKAMESKKLKLSNTFGKKTTKSSSGHLKEDPIKLKRSLNKSATLKNGLNKRASISKVKGPKEADKAVKGDRVGSNPELNAANNESSKSSMPANIVKMESDQALAQMAHNNNNNNNNNDISKSTLVKAKGSLPNASGDAPAQIKTEPAWEDQAALSRNSPPSGATYSSHANSHKSPHFTRFSKKKGSLN
ncbi:forkhead box protein N3 [Elysia marginata]|uniref:Forkhead box protein N3 n=1 Tax=Elysia marginata TaxID=1093978 RepID=A0AAV4E9W9_9GAST|nr:forkhead box protein N3 [Elysia marginata]